MAQTSESSVLFSIRSLMDIEKDRIRAEEQARVQREAREREASEQRRRLEVEAERQRVLLEEQRRVREQRAREDEEARLAMLKQAAVTQARIEAEARAELEALQKEREHEARMAAIRGTSRRRRDLVLLLGSNGVLLAVLAMSLGLYWGELLPAAVEREHSLELLVAAQGDRAVAAEQLARQAAGESSALRTELVRLRSKLADAEQRLEEQANEEPRSKPRSRGRVPVSPPKDPPRERCANEWDPMCGTLP